MFYWEKWVTYKYQRKYEWVGVVFHLLACCIVCNVSQGLLILFGVEGNAKNLNLAAIIKFVTFFMSFNRTQK